MGVQKEWAIPVSIKQTDKNTARKPTIMTIKIKDTQLKKLESYALENYITELVAHCDECYPHLRKTMGEEKLRHALKSGVDKAEQSGFTQRGPVQFYIDMLIAFGAGFETDPQYPWIRESLESTKQRPQIERSSALYYLTKDYSEKKLGPQSQYFFKAAEKLQALELEKLHVYKTGFVSYMHKILQEYYPQKYATSGEEAITALIQEGEQKAETRYGFTQARPTAVLVGMMFLLGHEFDNDPFYDWARLEKTSSYVDYTLIVDDQTFTANKLASRGKAWLVAAVENEKAFLLRQDNQNNQEKGIS